MVYKGRLKKSQTWDIVPNSVPTPSEDRVSLTLLTPGEGRKGPRLQFGLNRGHRGARREPKLFCKFIISSW